MRRDDESGNANYERDWQERDYERGRDLPGRDMNTRDDYGYMGRYDWGNQGGYQGRRQFERRYGEHDYPRGDQGYHGSHARGYGDQGGYGRGSMGTYEPGMTQDMNRPMGGRWQGNYAQDNWQGGQWTGEQLSDQEIRRRVYNAIDNNPRIPPTVDIDVQVHDCEVTLTGTVRNREAKMAAWDCAWAVPSVEDVHNNIRVVSRYRQGIQGQSQMGSQGPGDGMQNQGGGPQAQAGNPGTGQAGRGKGTNR